MVYTKAIEQSRSGTIIGHAQFCMRAGRRCSHKESIHDGDTASVDPTGNLSVRLLGVDAPEVSFPRPDSKPGQFPPIDGVEWQRLLDDPFAGSLPPFDPPLEPGLRQHIQAHTGPGTATNHAGLAKEATTAFEALVNNDATQLGMTTPDTFFYFTAFANDVMDRYGRLLCYLHPDQPDTPGPQRLPSYNERLLHAGWATPYFIWPNVDPFLHKEILDAVPAPGTAKHLADNTPALRRARDAVAAARRDGAGIYRSVDPLRLLPFELRFLGRGSPSPTGGTRRKPPDRWILDLTSDGNDLVPPQDYYKIANPEDRLFIPAEYVPLFLSRGWSDPTKPASM